MTIDIATGDGASGAVFSPCLQYRYRLWRRWGPGRALVFVMLNPSTADGLKDDPTIRKCVGFAKRLGYEAIEVGNLFAFRATNPMDLRKAGYPVGPKNDTYLTMLAGVYPTAVAAWGVNAQGQTDRTLQVVGIFARRGVPMNALALTQDGAPYHPLMLAYGEPELVNFL
jgi:hypothetical protein